MADNRYTSAARRPHIQHRHRESQNRSTTCPRRPQPRPRRPPTRPAPHRNSSPTSLTSSRSSHRRATWPISDSAPPCSCRAGWVSRCCWRGRRVSVRRSWPRRWRPSPDASCSACSAMRARTKPLPCTSGTTANSCCTPRCCARRFRRWSPTSTRCRRRWTASARRRACSSPNAPRTPAAAGGGALGEAGGAAHRRGRPRR